jgi:hypothetical protein
MGIVPFSYLLFEIERGDAYRLIKLKDKDHEESAPLAALPNPKYS